MRINPQIIRTPNGDELVVLTRIEFDALMADREDAEDVAIFDARMDELHKGANAPLPPEVSALVMRGDSLLRAIRKWRHLTQADVAAATNLSQGFLSDIEGRKKTGTRDTLRMIAQALDVPPEWLLATE
jgi:DNA-binding XRE family transcriptional regulator